MHARHQRVLVDFLHIDLDLGFTFAAVDGSENAARVVDVVSRFKNHVENAGDRQDIEQRLVELKNLIATP